MAACFSSHIHRIQQIVNAAVSNERVVAFLGRSMHNSVRAARLLGLLHVDDRDVVDIEEVDRPRSRPRRRDLYGVAGRALSARSR